MTKEIDISIVLIDGDIATIMGEKYQRIIKPQSFYDKLWGLLKTKLGDNVYVCDDMADRVLNLIKENIPEPYDDLKFGVSEWFLGYNECVKRIQNNLK